MYYPPAPSWELQAVRVKVSLPPSYLLPRLKNQRKSDPPRYLYPAHATNAFKPALQPIKPTSAAFKPLQTTSTLLETTMNLQKPLILTSLQPPESQKELAAERFALKDDLYTAY